MPNFLSSRKSKPDLSLPSGSVPAAIQTANPSSLQNPAWSTASSGAQVAFDILKESSDWLGPLKAATGGLSALITHYNRCVSNKRDAERILRRIESLKDSFAIPPSDRMEIERREAFIEKLNPISEKLAQVVEQGRILRFVKNMDQAQKITGLIEDIREAITDYQTSLQQAIYDSNCQLIESADLMLLNQLPHAKRAGYLSGDGRKCMAGTRIEVLQEIETWAEDPRNHRVYWLNGVAGGGKSAIARTLAERAFAAGDLGTSFFCSRDFTERNDLHLIFPTLAYDLAHRYAEFRAYIINLIKSRPDVGHESLSNQLEKLLIKPLKRTGLKIMIIIDALDECMEPDDQPASVILSLLARHINDIPSVKFFITGRPEPRIRTGFRLPLLQPQTEVFLLHEVDRAFVNRDIEIFLKDGLSELLTNRSDMDHEVPWPDNNDVATLVHKSGGLFIYADTVLKFIASNHESPKVRLRLITSMPDSSAYEGPLRVDPLYAQVLDEAYTNVGSRSPEIFRQFRDIVGTILLLFNPLSRTSLESLLNLPPASTRTPLRSLHSLLLVPNSNSTPIRAFHKSFPDYITDNSRCQDTRFYVDPMTHHARIAVLCFEFMQAGLKKNICELPPYAMNRDIKDLSSRRAEYIGDAMEYACLFWGRHLESAPKVEGDDLQRILELLKRFFNESLLYWLEVLSIIGHLRDAIHILHDVQIWLVDTDTSDSSLSEWIMDAERFILFFFDLIEEAAPHVYVSALPWSPASSLVRHQYAGHHVGMMVVNGVDPSWNACIRTILAEHPSHVTFSRKGDLIATVGDDEAQIFEAATGVHLITLDHSGCSAIAFSSDDTLLVSGGACEIMLWDLQTGGLIRRFVLSVGRLEVVVTCCAFSPSGLFIVSGDQRGDIQIWDTQSGSCDCILRGHSARVTSVCWSPNGTLLSGSCDGTIKTWDVSQRICSTTVSHGSGDGDGNVTFSADGCTVAFTSCDSPIVVFDTRTGKLITTIQIAGYPLNPICLSPMGDRIVFLTDSSMFLWDLTQDVNILRLPKDEGHVTSVALAPDGNSIICGEYGGYIRVWRTWIEEQYSNARSICDDVQFIANGRLAVSQKLTYTIEIWDVRTGSYVRAISSHKSVGQLAGRSPPSSICYSSYKKRTLIVDSCDPTFGVGSDHEPVACYEYSGRTVFTPDRQWLALCGHGDDTALVWDGHTGSYTHIFNCPSPIMSIEFSPDSSHLACSYLGGLQVWNITTGERVVDARSEFYHQSISEFDTSSLDLQSLSILRIPTFPASSIPWFRFSENGSQLATWGCLPGLDSTTQLADQLFKVILYDVSTGCILAKRVVEYGILSVSFLTNGTGLLIDAYSQSRPTITWNIPPTPHPTLPAEPRGRSISPVLSSTLPSRSVSLHNGHCLWDLSPPLFRYDETWILDQAGRKVCWIPPGQRGYKSDCRGKFFAIATSSGRVVVLDFSNVTLDSS